MSPREVVAFWKKVLVEDGVSVLKMVGVLALLLALIVLLLFLGGIVGTGIGGVFGLAAAQGAAAGRGMVFLGLVFLCQWLMLYRLTRLERRIRGIAREKDLDEETTDDLLSAASNGIFGGAGFVLFFVFFGLALASLKSAGL